MKFKFNDVVTVKSSKNGFFDKATGIVLEVYEVGTYAMKYNVFLKSHSEVPFTNVFTEDELEHYVND